MHIDLVSCSKCNINYFVPIVSGDNKFYKNLAKFDWYYQKNKIEYEYIKPYINENSKVLDIGCGAGYFANYLNNVEYTGLEPNTNENINLKSNFKIITTNLEQHSVDYSEYYDYVCLFQVLEHIGDPYSLLSYALKTLKRGGKLIISVPNNDSYLKFMVNGILNFPPHHLIRWNKISLNEISNIMGIKKIFLTELPLDDIHFSNFSYTFSRIIISTLFFIRHKEIQIGIFNKTLNVLTFPLVRVINKLLKDKILQPIGHSIVGIYEKV